jgi:argininosuccinate lyase
MIPKTGKMKLWDKGDITDRDIEEFTIGNDPELDLSLAPYDVLGTLAHAAMLHSIGILSGDEYAGLKGELLRIYAEIQQGKFTIEEGMEDVHSQLEKMLTDKLGETGKKVHTGRSRNDQVLLDLHLYIRERLQMVSAASQELFGTLCSQGEKYKLTLMPGYTHFQVAMPSSFGLWFTSFAEDLTDDMIQLKAAYQTANQNPLGSAAGFGSSIPVDRQMTTRLLGFDALRYNSMHAMMSRGRLEKTTAGALSSLAATLSRLAMDVCMYMGQNFGFLKLADEFTTGSSIMPHKKNPDVFELIRGKCNRILALPHEIELVISNLPSGYHRDFQVLKGSLIRAFDELLGCIHIADKALQHVEPRDDILDDPVYRYISSVERVNQLVMEGKPFREAYRIVAGQIKDGTFKPAGLPDHSHEGSTGNLCIEKIRAKMDERTAAIGFERANEAILKLLKE